jgi:hypothetical protein
VAPEWPIRGTRSGWLGVALEDGEARRDDCSIEVRVGEVDEEEGLIAADDGLAEIRAGQIGAIEGEAGIVAPCRLAPVRFAPAKAS